MPQGLAHYAWMQAERLVWGLTLEYEVCQEAYLEMTQTPQGWAIRDEVSYVGTIREYA